MEEERRSKMELKDPSMHKARARSGAWRLRYVERLRAKYGIKKW
jgi:hypothetical protein